MLGLCYKDQPIFALCDLPNQQEQYVTRLGQGVTRNGQLIHPNQETQLAQSFLVTCILNGQERMNRMVGELKPAIKGMHTRNSSLIEICEVISGKTEIGVWHGLGEHEWPTAWLLAKERGWVISELESEVPTFNLSGGGRRSFLITANEVLYEQVKHLVHMPPLEKI